MNQAEAVRDLLRAGWMSFQPDNYLGWKFFFKRDPDPMNYHEYFGGGWLYLTLYKSGRISDGIVETKHQRWVRRKQEILYRDFRDYPNWRQNVG